MRRGRGAAPHADPGAGDERPAATLTLDEAGATPILREYRAVKAEHPDAVVLARLGDFYEMFGEDAEIVAPLLGLTLTGRGFGAAGRLPMCGVPHHAAAGHVRRLLEAGQRVVIWDQVGEVVAGRLVRREVTRILSPGTVIEGEYLDEVTTARCVAVIEEGGRCGVAALDASCGELWLTETDGGLDATLLAEECARMDCAELVIADAVVVPQALAPRARRTVVPGAFFDASRAEQRIRETTGMSTLQALELDRVPLALRAAGAVLAYAERARLQLPQGFLTFRRPDGGGVMRLDPQTRRNLELLSPLSGSGPALVDLLDRTRTPMGARLLRNRLVQPLIDVEAITTRHESVDSLLDDHRRREAVRHALSQVRDLERLVTRCVQGIATPRDLVAVRTACTVLPSLRDLLEGIASRELAGAAERCDAPDDVVAMLHELLVDEPPHSARDGGVIREGADSELDELRAAGADARTYIASLEERERERTGIRSLKVGYNRVFGYYLEVPNGQRALVPGDYVRKQTLVGAERYYTPQMKEHEAVVVGARDRAIARELELVERCRSAVAGSAPLLLSAARAAAVIDVSQALATAAAEHGWQRPVIDTSPVLEIVEGRHPLVEASLGRHGFVANDCHLDAAARILVLTGPNMAGKSTFLRQVAVLVLLAQVGSHVPATSARIGIVDRIFTRIGAQDDLSAGLSTFMVEMAETAAILRNATPRSLVILDEIGRGTSTYDGLSIAQAVVEQLHDAPQLNCRTLFATHYHELTELADRLLRVRNARVDVVEEGETVTFVHRIVPGGADRSYGIHVARLAGVPQGVLVRARQLLAELEARQPVQGGADRDQLTLAIDSEPHPVVSELAQLQIDGLTPLAALNKLAELHERASG